MQHLIYWALIPILGSFAIAFIVYTFVIYGTCAIFPWSSSALPGPSSHEASSARLILSPYSAASFKFSKEIGSGRTIESSDLEDGMECAVCLFGFENDDVVRQLLRCKHSFHAPCIDMWMYSHSNCPICRIPVDRLAGLDDFTFEVKWSYMDSSP